MWTNIVKWTVRIVLILFTLLILAIVLLFLFNPRDNWP
jgi:hypothetical protein